MKKIQKVAAVLAATVAALLLPTGTAHATNSFGDSAHSHFDIHTYADHEVTFCYEVLNHATGAGSEIANLPHREQDGSNNMELRIRTDGLQLVERVGGVATTLTSSLPNPHLVFGDGSDVMIDYTMVGNTFTAYDFTGNVRGAALYQWTDSRYLTGVSISYYTIGGWHGLWEQAHGRPLDLTGQPHDISLPGLEQDARSHPQVGTEATFDSPIPASGGASDLISNATDGMASGANYTYTITTTGSGNAYIDTRDPGTATDTKFFQTGWLRLTPGGTSATLKQYTGTGTLAGTVTAPFGGAGTYTLQYVGGTATLTKAGSAGSAVSTGNNLSGLRVRAQGFTNGQTLTWAGQVNP